MGGRKVSNGIWGLNHLRFFRLNLETSSHIDEYINILDISKATIWKEKKLVNKANNVLKWDISNCCVINDHSEACIILEKYVCCLPFSDLWWVDSTRYNRVFIVGFWGTDLGCTFRITLFHISTATIPGYQIMALVSLFRWNLIQQKATFSVANRFSRQAESWFWMKRCFCFPFGTLTGWWDCPSSADMIATRLFLASVLSWSAFGIQSPSRSPGLPVRPIVS